MDWLRWHAGTVTDPKWRAVAADSGQPVHAVIAVWALMLETASTASERGTLEGWRDRVVAVALDISTEAVEAIRMAMQGLVLEGDRLTGWERRNPKREDGSAERARAWRERQKEQQTQPTADERNRPLDKRREDKIRKETTTTTALRPSKRVSKQWQPKDEHRSLAQELAVGFDSELALFRDHEFKDPRSDWDAGFRNWLRRAAEMPGKKNGSKTTKHNGNFHDAPVVTEWAGRSLT